MTGLSTNHSPDGSYDLIIIGGGIIGLSIAWQIARRSRLKVAVLERGAGVGEGSTGASSAVCRFRYSLDEVVTLAKDGIAAYRNWGEFTGLSTPCAQYHQEGVLWMPGEDKHWSQTQHQRMASLGVNTQVLDAHEIRQRFPSINPCRLAPDFESGEDHDCADGGPFFLETEGGYMDPVSAAQDLVTACRGSGVDVCFNTGVSDVFSSDSKVEGVELLDGRHIAAPLLINATGPWCQQLYRAAGVNLKWDIQPVRIQVLHRDRPSSLSGHIPITVDMNGGIYFRTQNRGQQLIVSSVLEEDEKERVDDPDEFSQVTDSEFELLKLHALHHRLPGLPYRGGVTGYCGLYTVNHDDVHPVLGPTDLEGFWIANGFSGHGFKLAPAIGSMIAREVTGITSDFDTDVPLSFLSISRDPIAVDSKSVLA